MKKFSLALSLLAASTGAAWAQSSVQMYGILDAAVRYQTSMGTTAATRGASLSQMVGGGMSQSRLGFNITEDLGGGLKAIGNMEHRLTPDNGVNASSFWAQSWVGIESSSFGRITMGRQYNLVFDATATTFASFQYSPWIEVFKPEVGMFLGARNDNMVKYLAESGGLRFEAQIGAGENAAGKSQGAMLRYTTGGFRIAGAYLKVFDLAGKGATATTLGGAYDMGPWRFNLGYYRNSFDIGYNATAIATGIAGTGLGALSGMFAGAVNASIPALAKSRDMWMGGVVYQATPQLSVGANVWGTKQYASDAAKLGNGSLRQAAIVVDYALSKRSDAYVEFDNSQVRGNLTLSNTARTRSSYMAGLRHRF